MGFLREVAGWEVREQGESAPQLPYRLKTLEVSRTKPQQRHRVVVISHNSSGLQTSVACKVGKEVRPQEIPSETSASFGLSKSLQILDNSEWAGDEEPQKKEVARQRSLRNYVRKIKWCYCTCAIKESINIIIMLTATIQ